MNEIKPLQLALVFAGCFLGAGYVSGQELMQYFGAFGLKGYPGLVIALLLIMLCGCLIMRLAILLETSDADKIMVPWKLAPLRAAAGILEIILLFAVVAIMTAGVGALLNQLFGISSILGSACFAILVLLVALAGLNGMVAAFSFIVPVLVVCAIGFGIASWIRYGFVPLRPAEADSANAMLGNWFMSAVNYMCFNIMAGMAIFPPLAKRIRNGKDLLAGTGMGALALLLIAMSVLTAVNACSGAEAAELPMLYAASGLAQWAGYLYGLLLAGGMFGTALSSLVGVVGYLAEKSREVKKHSKIVTLLIVAAAFAASLAGFGDLISVIYPIFGYAGAVFILLMLAKYLQLLVKNNVK